MRFKDDVSAGSGNFLKLKDGETRTGVFMGDPVDYYVKFENGKSIVCNPEDGGKFRFKINFVTIESGQFVSKIWEGGALVYETLRELNKEYGLEDTKVKIIRKGTGMDTTYSILPVIKEPLTANQKDTIRAVKLQPLGLQEKHGGAHNDPHLGDGNWPSPDDEIPF